MQITAYGWINLVGSIIVLIFLAGFLIYMKIEHRHRTHPRR